MEHKQSLQDVFVKFFIYGAVFGALMVFLAWYFM